MLRPRLIRLIVHLCQKLYSGSRVCHSDTKWDFAHPDQTLCRAHVYLSNEWHLSCLFGGIILIDAQLINPQRPRPISMYHLPERGRQGLCNLDIFPVDLYDHPILMTAPHIREGFIAFVRWSRSHSSLASQHILGVAIVRERK
jgi:hypothetical protein